MAIVALLIPVRLLGEETARRGRPRIFIRAGDVAELRARCKKDPALSKKYGALRTFAKRFRVRPTNPHRDATSLEALAFVYVVEDRSPKILEKIRSCLKPYLEGDREKETFGAARLLRAVSIVFDWCYDDLTKEEREKLGGLILALAEKFYGAYPTYRKPFCFLSEVNGRGDWIRTSGLLLPKQALCQAELRPVSAGFYHRPRRMARGIAVASTAAGCVSQAQGPSPGPV